MILRMEIETDGVTTRVEREYEPEFIHEETMAGDAAVHHELPPLDDVARAVAAAAAIAHRVF